MKREHSDELEALRNSLHKSEIQRMESSHQKMIDLIKETYDKNQQMLEEKNKENQHILEEKNERLTETIQNLKIELEARNKSGICDTMVHYVCCIVGVVIVMLLVLLCLDQSMKHMYDGKGLLDPLLKKLHPSSVQPGDL